MWRYVSDMGVWDLAAPARENNRLVKSLYLPDLSQLIVLFSLFFFDYRTRCSMM